MSKERELLQSVMEESWDFLYAGTHTEIKELLAQPEQKPEPEQKPLSDRQIKILYGRDASDMDNQEYIWGFRDAEKAHGIGVDDEN